MIGGSSRGVGRPLVATYERGDATSVHVYGAAGPRWTDDNFIARGPAPTLLLDPPLTGVAA